MAVLRQSDPRFRETIAAAVGQAGAIEAFVESLGPVTDVWFVGCGGSLASSIQSSTELSSASQVPNTVTSSADFVAAAPVRVGPASVVVASSHSGATPETVAALDWAIAQGARTVTLSSPRECHLSARSDLHLFYENDRTITSAKQILLLQLAAALLRVETGSLPDGLATAIDSAPDLLAETATALDPWCARVAPAIAEASDVLVVGSGANFGAAYLLSMCYLMEMQWKHSASFRAGEFFHGAFEMTNDDSLVVNIRTEDPGNAASDRVERFLQNHAATYVSIDSRDFLSAEATGPRRRFLAPIAAGLAVARLLEHLEALRDHDIDQRRFMGRVDY